MELLEGESRWEPLCGTFCLGLGGISVSKTFKGQGENVSVGIIRRKISKGGARVGGTRKLTQRRRLVGE